MLRPFNLTQDISAFVELLSALDHESSEADVTAQRQELADLAFVIDVLVAEHDGQLVGFSDIWKNPRMARAALTLAVHPAYRNQGIGNALFQKSIHNAQTLGIESLLVYVSAEDDTTQAFFKRRTSTKVSGFRRFTLNVINPLPIVQWPAGVNVQPYSKINRPQLHTAASNQSWGDLWGHQVVTDQATQMVLAAFTHDGIFIAFDAHRKIVGICKAQEISTPTSSSDTPTGYIDAPGIVPEHRNQQFYTNMLVEAAMWLYNKGHTHMMLESWGDLDLALAAYTDLGFELSEHELAFVVTV